jgi:hypothetical protein
MKIPIVILVIDVFVMPWLIGLLMHVAGPNPSSWIQVVCAVEAAILGLAAAISIIFSLWMLTE